MSFSRCSRKAATGRLESSTEAMKSCSNCAFRTISVPALRRDRPLPCHGAPDRDPGQSGRGRRRAEQPALERGEQQEGEDQIQPQYLHRCKRDSRPGPPARRATPSVAACWPKRSFRNVGSVQLSSSGTTISRPLTSERYHIVHPDRKGPPRKRASKPVPPAALIAGASRHTRRKRACRRMPLPQKDRIIGMGTRQPREQISTTLQRLRPRPNPLIGVPATILAAHAGGHRERQQHRPG